MEAALLPGGDTLEHVVDYHTYRKALVQRDDMVKALQQVQDDIANLEQEYAEMTNQVTGQQEKLQETAQALTRSADLCSMVGQ
jgi:predicted  nucleic acid-binding Zn-ribbon protein